MEQEKKYTKGHLGPERLMPYVLHSYVDLSFEILFCVFNLKYRLKSGSKKSAHSDSFLAIMGVEIFKHGGREWQNEMLLNGLSKMKGV